MTFRSTLLLFSILSLNLNAQNTPVKITPQLTPYTVKEIIKTMTLDEKVNFIKGISMGGADIFSSEPVIGDIKGKVNGAAGATLAIPRMGIPSIILADGPAGLRIDSLRPNDSKRYYATAFPVGTALAATWNPALVQKVGEAMGNEVLEYGLDLLLAPGINIQRNPLCGRNFEYYSEDPYLTGTLAAAMVNGIQSNGIGATIKHYAANNQETSRNKVDEIISERALREIYLKAFEITIKQSQPWSIMSAFNKINGVYCSESEDLLTTVLRKEWGYKGFVMTDWFAGKDFVAQVRAGNDLMMPGRVAESTKIKEAIINKNLSEDLLDRNIESILNIVLKSSAYRNYKYSNNPDLVAHSRIVREAGAEGMVLLKNVNNVLPLSVKKIVLLGNGSYETFIGGTGSGEVYKAYTVSISQGLSSAGFEIYNPLKNKYLGYIDSLRKADTKPITLTNPLKTLKEMAVGKSDLTTLAASADMGVITISRIAGEGVDRKTETDYYLKSDELNLISDASQAFHAAGKKLVVILNVNGVVDVTTWRDKVDGILVAWLPGQEVGNSVADVLGGKVNPSGRLAASFPMNYNVKDVASASSFPGTPAAKPTTSVYDEGIYVGYRYYNSFDIKTAYPFGFGLSYTTFSYTNLKLSSATFNRPIKATVTITNTGKVAGKEVVQLYLSAPTTSIDKPAEELKGFAKTRLLKQGESQTITFTLYPKDLASFNTSQSVWIADAGRYTVKIGASSEDIKLKKLFTLAKDIVVEKVNRVHVPQVPVDELKANKDYKLDSK